MTENEGPDRPLYKAGAVAQSAGDGRALVDLVATLSDARTLPEVMYSITAATRELLGAGGVTVVLRDGDLCHYAEEDAIAPLWKGKRFPMSACISGWCMTHRRSAVIPDIFQDSRIPRDAYRPTFVRSLAMVPLPGDEPMAAIGAYWPQVHETSDQEMELIATIANAASLAFANVRLRQESLKKSTERREASHRIKNIFTVLQTLAEKTGGNTLDDYRRTFMDRLRALEHAHALLYESDGGTSDLRTLAEGVLSPLVNGGGARLRLEGPSEAVSGTAARDLALVFHELGTNALKYGAWSAEFGLVSLRWTREDERLRLHWDEAGGPPVTAPARVGFGSRLIKGLVTYDLGGSVSFSYRPDGFCCALRVPLDRKDADDSEGERR